MNGSGSACPRGRARGRRSARPARRSATTSRREGRRTRSASPRPEPARRGRDRSRRREHLRPPDPSRPTARRRPTRTRRPRGPRRGAHRWRPPSRWYADQGRLRPGARSRPAPRGRSTTGRSRWVPPLPPSAGERRGSSRRPSSGCTPPHRRRTPRGRGWRRDRRRCRAAGRAGHRSAGPCPGRVPRSARSSRRSRSARSPRPGRRTDRARRTPEPQVRDPQRASRREVDGDQGLVARGDQHVVERDESAHVGGQPRRREDPAHWPVAASTSRTGPDIEPR